MMSRYGYNLSPYHTNGRKKEIEKKIEGKENCGWTEKRIEPIQKKLFNTKMQSAC
jgi:hypothetical protein